MLIVKLSGGMGNQMFQYALGRSLSLQKNILVKYDTSGYVEVANPTNMTRSYKLNVFNTEADIATPEELKAAKYPFGIVSKAWRRLTFKLKQHYLDYHPEILERDFKKIKFAYLEGFFQSEKYFDKPEIAAAIRKDFELRPEFKSPAMKEWAAKIEQVKLSQSEQSVSLHVRRGDYVTSAEVNKVLGVPLAEYYKQAIEHIAKNIDHPHFFVFSDDIEWVKENIKIPFAVEYVSNPNLMDYEELTLMSLCQNAIIANSSFSWWAAWLSANPAKIVTAPKTWTLDGTHPNILPPNWVPLG